MSGVQETLWLHMPTDGPNMSVSVTRRGCLVELEDDDMDMEASLPHEAAARLMLFIAQTLPANYDQTLETRDAK